MLVPMLVFVGKVLQNRKRIRRFERINRNFCLLFQTKTFCDYISWKTTRGQLKTRANIQKLILFSKKSDVTVLYFCIIKPYLRINSDWFSTFITLICKHILITFDTIWLLISHDIPLSSQSLIALPTTEMVTVPVFIHGFCVFSSED